ncbi:hypothetical protein Y1Q_0009353 [Alligator mississippiensis]|uniref:Uncharacterized protein n=1 Tax=Alligator mississippiensis TaxID=8496 RepID=A0A151N823_ALLMI|nr:hypothetical protein Y1Q_0009353 [Alligator mississippiensis]
MKFAKFFRFRRHFRVAEEERSVPIHTLFFKAGGEMTVQKSGSHGRRRTSHPFSSVEEKLWSLETRPGYYGRSRAHSF